MKFNLIPIRLPPLSAQHAGLQQAAVLVAGASAMFAKWARGFQAHTNALPLFDQATSNAAGGDPNIRCAPLDCLLMAC